jgi:transcription initiation factor TFIID subunit 11
MENFLNENNDHNSSFFQPPREDDEMEPTDEPNSSSEMETISPVKTDPKPEESSLPKTDRPRSKTTDEEANIKLQVLVSNFSDEQLDRYEVYRRSAFSKVSIKRLMHSITGSVPSSNVVIAMAGIAKVFVGEIVEEALELQRQENESKNTPLEPKHLREACRRLNNQDHCPQRKTWKTKKKSRF